MLGVACASACAFSCAGGGGKREGGGAGTTLVIGGAGSFVRVARIAVDGGMATRAEAAWNGHGYGVFYNLGTTADVYFVATDAVGVAPRRVLGGWLSGAAFSGEGYAVTHNRGLVLLDPDGAVKVTVRLPHIDNPIGVGPVRWNRDAGEWIVSAYGSETEGGGVRVQARPVWQIVRVDPSGRVTGVVDGGQTCEGERICARTVPIWNGTSYAVAYGGSETPLTVVELGGDDDAAGDPTGAGAGFEPLAGISLARDGSGYALAFRVYQELVKDEIVFARVRGAEVVHRTVLAKAAADRFVHSPVVYSAGDRAVVVWEEGPPGVFDGRLYFAVVALEGAQEGRVVSARRRLDDLEQPQEWPHFVDAPQPAVVYIVGPQEGPGEIRVAAITP